MQIQAGIGADITLFQRPDELTSLIDPYEYRVEALATDACMLPAEAEAWRKAKPKGGSSRQAVYQALFLAFCRREYAEDLRKQTAEFLGAMILMAMESVALEKETMADDSVTIKFWPENKPRHICWEFRFVLLLCGD